MLTVNFTEAAVAVPLGPWTIGIIALAIGLGGILILRRSNAGPGLRLFGLVLGLSVIAAPAFFDTARAAPRQLVLTTSPSVFRLLDGESVVAVANEGAVAKTIISISASGPGIDPDETTCIAETVIAAGGSCLVYFLAPPPPPPA
jgi:hypothetical protein